VHRRDVGEDRIGRLGLLQRLALLDPLEPVAQPVEDVAHRPLLGQVLLAVAFGDQGRADLGGRQVGVPPRRLQLGVGVGLRLDDGSDLPGQLRVLVLAAAAAPRAEVLQAVQAGVSFVHALLEGLSSPAEAALGLARTAVTECQADLGLESAALKAGEAMGAGAKQLLITIHITDHGG
jgi:hypothetical protein